MKGQCCNHTSLGSESITTQPYYMKILPGTTGMGIPIAESTPVPQVGPTLLGPFQFLVCMIFWNLLQMNKPGQIISKNR